MSAGDWLVVALLVQQVIVAIVYAFSQQWWKGLYWLAAALLNLSILGIAAADRH